MTDHDKTVMSGKGFLARTYWMFLGNIPMVFLLAFIVAKRSAFPSLLDGAYVATLVSLVVVRYVDIRFLNGQTGECEPAAMEHWKRYSGCWLLWAVVHGYSPALWNAL